MKKKFSICGNCQAQPIGQLLMNNPTFSNEYEFVPFPKPIFMLTKDDYNDIKLLIESLDVFLFQNISEAFGKLFSSKHLCSLTKDACEKISYPSLYFTGYFPELIYLRKVGQKGTEFSDYHDANIVNNFLNDEHFSFEKSIKAIEDINFYHEDYILENAKNSLTELKKREIELTITISDFIQDNWLNERLFFSMNHPSRKVLVEVSRRILSFLKVNDNTIPGDYEYLSETQPPIYQSVQRLLKNKNSTTDIKTSGNNLTLSQYIKSHLAIYKQLNKRHIIANMKELNKYVEQTSTTLEESKTLALKDKKVIFIHVGMSKTGSTSLQKAFTNNQQSLKENDILYPKSARVNGVSHHALANFFKQDGHKIESEKLLNEINNSKESNILISSELFENMSEQKWLNLKSFFSPHTVKIVIYLRPQEDAIISMYNELVKKHACSLPFSEYIKQTPRLTLLDYNKLLTLLSKVFNKKNIFPCIYNIKNNISITEQFFQHAFNKEIAFISDTTRKSNSSLSPLTIAVLAKINSLTDFCIDHSKHYAIACKLAFIIEKNIKEAFPNLNKEVYFQTDDELKSFKEKYAESNRNVESEYLKGEKFPEIPKKIKENLTDDDLAPVVDYILIKIIEYLLTSNLTVDNKAQLVGAIWKVNTNKLTNK